MKTQVIHLESHDDTYSVKDKMDWSQTPRVLLVWPEDTPVLTERLDLILLERHCTAMGSQIALVTQHPDIRFHAQHIGIPVFKSKQEAQAAAWHRSQRFYRRRDIKEQAADHTPPDLSERPQVQQIIDLPKWAQLAVFTLGVLMVLLMASLFIPQATISLPLQDERQEVTLPVRASPEIKAVHLSGLLPLRELTLSIEKRAYRSASGTMELPDQHASGFVIIENLTNHEINLPANTILSTGDDPPLRYLTLSKVTVPSRESVEVKIKALKAGEAGNQPPGAITAISADIGADLLVENREPITGGTDVLVPIPTELDRQRLANRVMEEIRQSSLNSLSEQLGPDDILVRGTLQVEEIEEQLFKPEEGQPGEELELRMRVQLSGMVIRHQDMMTLAEEIMRARRGSDQVQLLADTLTVSQQSAPIRTGQNEVEWDLTVSWRQSPLIQRQEVIRLVLGQPASRAKQRLEGNFNLEKIPQISTRPAWWPRLPLIPFRIDVQEQTS